MVKAVGQVGVNRVNTLRAELGAFLGRIVADSGLSKDQFADKWKIHRSTLRMCVDGTMSVERIIRIIVDIGGDVSLVMQTPPAEYKGNE